MNDWNDKTLVGWPCLAPACDHAAFELRHPIYRRLQSDLTTGCAEPGMLQRPAMAEYRDPDQRGLRGSQPVELPKPRVRSQVRRRPQPPPQPKFSWRDLVVAFSVTFLLGCCAIWVWT